MFVCLSVCVVVAGMPVPEKRIFAPTVPGAGGMSDAIQAATDALTQRLEQASRVATTLTSVINDIPAALS